MLHKLERDGLQADLANVNTLLAGLSEEDDPVGYAQFAARRAEIERALAAMERVSEGSGKVVLLFGGRPVWGSRGIDADFAAKAIDQFQRAVGAQAAGAAGPVGTRGRLARDVAPRLLVTDVGRGSFGFVLEEAAENEQLVETPTRYALDDIARLARAAAATDDESFDAAITVIEPRALQALAEFFKQLHENGAQLRLVAGAEDVELDAAAIDRARARTEQTRIDSETLEEEGVLVGLVPRRKTFEWRRANGETIVGTVQGDIARAYEDSLFKDHLLLGPMRARFEVRKVSRRGGAPRLAYTLLAVARVS
ncbi:MAG TPA: hypothetical protein VNK91_12005 [Burkholderiaceae bacterium]|nr:hypothetical protein [Burkholderiaceae bacterium]